MSKVFRDTGLFVPEQILPHRESPGAPVWQETADPQQFTPEPQSTHLSQTLPAGSVAEKNSAPETTIPEETQDDVLGERQEPPIDAELIRQQAYAAGIEEGKRQSFIDFGICGQTFRVACDQLNRIHETILRNNTEEMHELVLIIAEKIIRHSVAEQSETVLATIEDAIRLAVKSDEFHIRVNPDDLAVITKRKQEILDAISGLDNISLKADSHVDRGGCIIESANCTVDATITGQIQVVREALQNFDSLMPVIPDDNRESQI